MNIREQIESVNIAEHLNKEELLAIAEKVVNEFDGDVLSRAEWEEKTEEWVNLATQIVQTKNWPWQGAANVKYPLVAISAMQFAARAYPSLVPANGDVVQVKVIGKDPDGAKHERAGRLAKHMSWQLMYQMEEWEEDMDRLLLNLPIIGCAFKKTYYDAVKGRNCSYLVLAKDLVVNYWAKTLEEARKTHILYMTKNDVLERIGKGLYLNVDLGAPEVETIGKLHGKNYTPYVGSEQTTSDDAMIPHTILEQHTWLDLDEDGYSEPYVVTVDYTTRKLLRIVARFDEDGIEAKPNGTIVRIKAHEYFTKFSFIPNPDGGFYDVGFGMLLGSINNTLNTLINQLIDAGTLNNLQSGYIARGLTLKSGSHMFKPGEWKVVNPTSDDLRKGIVPLPTNEPSQVLFSLFELLEQSGKQLASVAEIMVGKMPGQNTPATTTMATVQEGMRLFTAVYKRVYRSLGKEYKKLFELNGVYLDDEEEFQVLDEPQLQSIGKQDYEAKGYDVVPIGDPTAVTAEQKLAKTQALLELAGTGLLNMPEVVKRALEAQEQPNIEALINQGPPPPSPEQQKAQAEQQMMQMEGQIKEKEAGMKAQLEMLKGQLKQQEAQMDMKMKEADLQIKQLSALLDFENKRRESQLKQQEHEQSMEHGSQEHAMSMQHAHEQNQQKLQQQKEAKNAVESKAK